MANGLLLFVVSQGDRVIIGNRLSIKELGFYSAVMLLIYYPSALLGRYIHAMYIPLIAGRRDSVAGRNEGSDQLGGQTVILSIAMALGFATVAPLLIPVLFGARYQQAALLVGLIGLLQTSRFMLTWPTTVALAMGRSTTVLLCNLAHLFAFLFAFIGLWLMGGLMGIVVGFTLGEIMAIGVALLLMNHGMERPWWSGLDRMAEFVLACVCVVGWNFALGARAWPAEAAMLGLSAVCAVWLIRREFAVIVGALAILQRFARPLLQGRRRLPARSPSRRG
jgi:O-antigen/teichoic acid export membrane protein